MNISANLTNDTLDIIEQALKVKSLNGLNGIVKLMQDKVGISGCIYGRKEVYEPNLVDRSVIESYGIDPSWVDQYKKKRLDSRDPVARAAFECQHPIIWRDIYKAATSAESFIALSKDYGLVEGVTSATRSGRFTGAATCVSAIFDRQGIDILQVETLRRVLPHINEALSNTKVFDNCRLTAREIEILKWTREGKSSWETGVIMNVSERTVKFHLDNAYKKLGVHSRTHAVVKAIRYGFIEL